MMKRPPIYLSFQGPSNPEVNYAPPLGMMYVASALKRAGWDVRQFHLHGPNDTTLIDAINEEMPLFVGLSNFVSPTVKLDIRLSRALKKKGVKLVWGGLFATSLPEITLSSDCIDYIVVGEAENSHAFLRIIVHVVRAEDVLAEVLTEVGGRGC